MMHRGEKSDLSIVAGKPANGVGRPKSELVERREGAEENTGQASTRRTPSRASVSPGLGRVRTTFSPSIQGGSRMRECRTSGSVRGVLSNGHPYRNLQQRPKRLTRIEADGRSNIEVFQHVQPALAQLVLGDVRARLTKPLRQHGPRQASGLALRDEQFA